MDLTLKSVETCCKIIAKIHATLDDLFDLELKLQRGLPCIDTFDEPS